MDTCYLLSISLMTFQKAGLCEKYPYIKNGLCEIFAGYFCLAIYYTKSECIVMKRYTRFFNLFAGKYGITYAGRAL